VAGAKAYKWGDASSPKFPLDYQIAKKAVLQVTDIKNNNNKYYAVELHNAGANFRVFTHYGRTDDLENNPNAGQKECRFFSDAGSAQSEYDRIYREKTSKAKGYKEVALASSKIGSQKAVGQSSGDVDAKTLAKIKAPAEAKKKVEKKKFAPVPDGVSDLVKTLFAEATHALTTTVAAKITANGIETPLGVLTVGQVEKGEEILTQIHAQLQAKKGSLSSGKSASAFESLSGDFYTAIPHRIGRTRDAVQSAIIDTLAELVQKQETLQLMKDMLAVNGDGGSVLFDDKTEEQYAALGVTLEALASTTAEWKKWAAHVLESQVKSKSIKVQNVFKVQRPSEWESFDSKVGNDKMLFHGSRVQNWVGLLTRGILMPKVVVSMGVGRTDAGWLGNGIYFGDASCTSAFYTTPSKKKTRYMCINRVGLGKMKDYTKITYGLNEPPKGYDSTHGVRRQSGVTSEFDDDEYVIYRQNQQRMEYLVEFTT
jgi:poly [ADP-ribose] polymerase 2/3/4